MDPAGIFFFWKGERPLEPNAPELEGTAEIRLESADRARGWWISRAGPTGEFFARTSGIFFRADPGDTEVLDGSDASERAALIEKRLEEWRAAANS